MHTFISRFIRRLARPIARVFLGLARASLLSFLFVAATTSNAQEPETVKVSSSVFDHHGMVPEEFSGYGANTSIDLSWTNLPKDRKSVV